MAFVKAKNKKFNLRMAITGPAGSGKTYTALNIAKHLGGKTAVIDTEGGSSLRYSDEFDFDVDDFFDSEQVPKNYKGKRFNPGRLIEAMKEAQRLGYQNIIVDSFTHFWNAEGGILDIIESKGGRFTDWKLAKPMERKFLGAMMECKSNLIITMRSKMEHEQVKDERTGRLKVQKMGMAPEQRKNIEYEFDIVLDMDMNNIGHFSKSRCSALSGMRVENPGSEVAGELTKWMNKASAPVLNPKAEVKTDMATGEQLKKIKVYIKDESKPEKIRLKAKMVLDAGNVTSAKADQIITAFAGAK